MREMKAYGRYFYPLQPLIKNKVYFLFCSATHMYVWTGSKQTQILIVRTKMSCDLATVQNYFDLTDIDFRNLFALLYPFYDHFAGGNDNTFADKHRC